MEERERTAYPSINIADEVITPGLNNFRKLNLPRMSTPEGSGSDYVFPDDVLALSDTQLGSLQLWLTGWYTYSLSVLASRRSYLDSLNSSYELLLGVRMGEYEDKKLLKDALRGLVHKDDPQLFSLRTTIDKLKVEVRQLEAQAEIYKEQRYTLSREQSRREAEARALV